MGRFASAVEFSTMPTMRNLREAISDLIAQVRGPRVLETATSSGVDGARPSDVAGIPGPPSGAPNRSALRVASPTVTVPPAYTRGAAAVTPGIAAIRARSTGANGVAPTNGPDAPSLTTNSSTPSARSTVAGALICVAGVALVLMGQERADRRLAGWACAGIPSLPRRSSRG